MLCNVSFRWYAVDAIEHKGGLTMSKSQDTKRDTKKAPQKTLEEKRQAKREKKKAAGRI